MKKKVGIVKDKIFLAHYSEFPHPENPERLLSINQMIDNNELLKDVFIIAPREATFDEVSLIHSPQYIRKVQDTQNFNFSTLDSDTYATKSTYKTALIASGSLIDCVKKVVIGELDSAFAFLRPPGHHAEKDRAMGFCIFNNIAIAAEFAVNKLGLQKVAVVDFDIHHGNGTQNSFWDTDEVLYISTHQYPYYPGTGSLSEVGSGKGKGFTVNIPLPVGFGDPEFTAIFREIIYPVLEEYKPSLILVSAGFDIYESDPLGSMKVTDQGFCNIGNILRAAAEKVSNGKIIYVLEGGYSPIGLAEGSKNILKTLLNDKVPSDFPKTKTVPEDSRKTIKMIKENIQTYWTI